MAPAVKASKIGCDILFLSYRYMQFTAIKISAANMFVPEKIPVTVAAYTLSCLASLLHGHKLRRPEDNRSLLCIAFFFVSPDLFSTRSRNEKYSQKERHPKHYHKKDMYSPMSFTGNKKHHNK